MTVHEKGTFPSLLLLTLFLFENGARREVLSTFCIEPKYPQGAVLLQ